MDHEIELNSLNNSFVIQISYTFFLNVFQLSYPTLRLIDIDATCLE